MLFSLSLREDSFFKGIIKKNFIYNYCKGTCRGPADSGTKRAIILKIALLFIVSLTEPAMGKSIFFEPIQNILIKDGFNKKFIKNIYKKRAVKFQHRNITLYFGYKESGLNYKQFTQKKAVKSCKDYMKRHASAFSMSEKTYKVDKEIITAILLVETRLGTSVGRFLVLNTLSTMASLADPAVREAFWSKEGDKIKLSKAKFNKKADYRSKWAYVELKAFLNYIALNHIDPTKIKGSFAGAMGIPQFMPSNIKFLGKDGNNDQRVNLFDHSDAIASVANYLKYYGWRPGIDKKEAGKVILHYNRSKYYVNAVLKISNILKGVK